MSHATQRLPRWYRERCKHPDAVRIATFGLQLDRVVCPACGANLRARAGA